jgi:hypothetical protein
MGWARMMAVIRLNFVKGVKSTDRGIILGGLKFNNFRLDNAQEHF